MIDETLMSFDEKCTYKLRSLYRKYGYLPYKMGKFEEYELYSRNKDFLVSDRVIAFNDTNGRLMALKPDVTLSIIKNGEDSVGCKQKVYYCENVYRVSESTQRFKEILQTGLECIGDIDIYDIYEAVTLAAESLSVIADNFCIEVSNLDLVRRILTSACDNAAFVSAAISCISEKNAHDLKSVCQQYGVSDTDYKKIVALISVYGDRKKVLAVLQELFPCEEVRVMTQLSDLLDCSAMADKIRFDFSLVNDMNYYNGFVFKGFVDGVCCGVLAGGQYDNMMKKLDRKSGAVGFAIYLDRLEDLNRENDSCDVDYVLLYDDSVDVKTVAEAVKKHIAAGETVSAQKNIPEKLHYKKLLKLQKED